MTFEDELNKLEENYRYKWKTEAQASKYCYKNDNNVPQMQFFALDKFDENMEIDNTKDLLIVCVGVNYGQNYDAEKSALVSSKHDHTLSRIRNRLPKLLNLKSNTFHILYTNLIPFITDRYWTKYDQNEQDDILEKEFYNNKDKVPLNYIKKLSEMLKNFSHVKWVFHGSKNSSKLSDALEKCYKMLELKNDAFIYDNLSQVPDITKRNMRLL